jgi:hypothetical protein
MAMQTNWEACHGVLECLQPGSSRWWWNVILRPWQKIRSYAVWHIENLGWSKGLQDLCPGVHHRRTARTEGRERGAPTRPEEALGLRPGEWVQVKSVEEILSTLDGNRRHRGLLWMTGMRKYCGRRFRVYKPVDTIMLETNGELRKMKHTVLLEDVVCDGTAFGGCDRSCFHFWREVWLRRVPEPEEHAPINGQTPPDKREV